MKEQDYIDASNHAKICAARELLNDVFEEKFLEDVLKSARIAVQKLAELSSSNLRIKD